MRFTVFLRETDKTQHWCGLQKVVTNDGNILWLSAEHARFHGIQGAKHNGRIGMTYLDAAYTLLPAAGQPLHFEEVTRRGGPQVGPAPTTRAAVSRSSRRR